MGRAALMFLLDTDVVAELRQGVRADALLVAWAAALTREHLFLSAISLLDLENAAAEQGRRDKAAGVRLLRWIDTQVVPAFEGRILPVDAAVVQRRRHIALADPRDALIAATAAVQGLTIATRRLPAFKAAKIKLVDPWKHAPDETDWRQANQAEPHWLKTLFVRA